MSFLNLDDIENAAIKVLETLKNELHPNLSMPVYPMPVHPITVLELVRLARLGSLSEEENLDGVHNAHG
jgi:hypothetical protein